MLGRAAPGWPRQPVAWRSSTHDECVVSLRQRADLRERRDVAVHGADAVGDDQAGAGAPGLLEEAFEIGHLAVLVAGALGPVIPSTP